eukprot:TRINITY_DN3472_c0_g1_i2.p2 TRINITY_DN3472_c0_g1~~TRINITY_DN3472_c0_g1_i2.p2  ORF type:complete len:215 (-),score=31.00 TRINITY_DN3472_c0_g1_i2:104-748(-)
MQSLVKAVRDMFKEWKVYGMEELEHLKQQHLQAKEALQQLANKREERRQRQEEILMGQLRQTARLVREQQQQQLDMERQMQEQIFQALENMKVQEVQALGKLEKGVEAVSKQKIQDFKAKVKQILLESRAKVIKKQKDTLQKTNSQQEQQSSQNQMKINGNSSQQTAESFPTVINNEELNTNQKIVQQDSFVDSQKSSTQYAKNTDQIHKVEKS